MNFVCSEKNRPVPAETAQNRVLTRSHNFGLKAFGHFNAIIVWKTGHRQCVLDGGATPPGLAVDALEAEVPSHQHKPPARGGPIADQLKSVRNWLPVQPNTRRPQ